MGVVLSSGNPYPQGSLKRAAWQEGWSDWENGKPRRRLVGLSPDCEVAYEAGYTSRKWHRSPNGQLKWHRANS